LHKKEITLKARGRFIAKAVYLASIFQRTAIKITNINIGTSMFINPTGESRPVSFIEISLSMP
jgi:DNA-binding protein Alba